MEIATLIRADEAAAYLNLSPSTLAKMRLAGTSPKFVKMGRRVAYRREDLDAWVNERLKSSTAG
ncbi:helix-turn-helix transcriptional regulator [Roseibium aggregatum]|uniref:helix-turn-helix transcriptional regulator n=1 Tax=Roseibium aggregatum TaxID=187304 RepID=UPI000A99AFEC|nr:helix-turn-helix domain-containing protein [Roseibium aggregatum]UFI02150.1 helix-turn-helix domain-containing protein [Roseibium aggregatum]